MSDDSGKILTWALAAEERAAARARAFAKKAEQEGLPAWSPLFKALAEAQRVRANRWLMLVRGKVGDTAANLREAFLEESPARRHEYERLAAQAEQAGKKTLASAFAQAAQVEERCAELHGQAGPAGPKAKAYQVCQVCGYLAEDEPPERCPVCGAVPEKFKRVE